MLSKFEMATLIGLLMLGAGPAAAQDDGPVDIDVGSRRIGGPGTSSEKKADAALDQAIEEDETPMTEETLPPKGNKKRIPALHKLATQYFGGKMWKEACEKYTIVIEEGGDEGLDVAPEGKNKAARSFYECAQIAFFAGDYDLVERLLKKSERYAPADRRHASLRRKIVREQFRRAMSNGDVNTSVTLFRKFQAEQADDDERIWMGEELAKRAWNAYNKKDKVEMQELIRQTEEIAPMNTELRKLKSKLETEQGAFRNVLILGGLAIALVGLLKAASQWRSRRRVRRATSGVFQGKDGNG